MVVGIPCEKRFPTKPTWELVGGSPVDLLEPLLPTRKKLNTSDWVCGEGDCHRMFLCFDCQRRLGVRW